MKDNVSPEEKLLRLIRGHKKPEVSVKNKPSAQALGMKADSALKLRKPKTQTSQNIITISVIVFAILSLYLIFAFTYPLFGLKNIRLPKDTAEKTLTTQAESKENEKNLDYYLQGVKNKQIFSGVSTQTPDTNIPSATAINADLIKDLSLIGIISGNNPQAVIEDKKSQKTYYVTKGQYINEFQVEDIAEGKIILNYKSQKYELYI